jgi:hypothetical protein
MGVADLLLTWLLIELGDGQVLESNPVANWWLMAHGWGGMTAFKLVMIALVGGLCVSIARRRPRAGELLLVFGCGAQAAVVLQSVLLTSTVAAANAALPPDLVWEPGAAPDEDPGRRPARPAFLGENERIALLAHKAVQKELQLSPWQIQESTRLAAKRRELRMSFRNVSREGWDKTVADQLAQEQTLLDSLETQQTDRLQQIVWQQRGPAALTDPVVSDALELSDKQLASIRAIVNETKKPGMMPFRGKGGPGSPRPPADALERGKSKALAVLTVEQRTRWRELIGQPITVEFRPETPFGAFGRTSPKP